MAIELPEFATSGVDETEPLTALKSTGWAGGDEPPAQVFNWLHRTTYESLREVVRRLGSLSVATWQAQSPDASFADVIPSALWAPELGLFFIGQGAGGSPGYVQTSPTGRMWTQQTRPEAQSLNAFAWSGSVGISVHTNSGDVGRSTDGLSWSNQGSPTGSTLLGATWDGSQFIVTGASGGIATSPTGLSGSWTTRTPAASFAGSFWDVTHGNGTLLAAGSSGTLQTSTDSGATWTARTAAGSYTGTFYAARYAPHLGKFFAVGDSGEIQSSDDDGATWTAETSGTANRLRTLSYSEDYELLLAAGDSGTILTSRDGETWTPRTPDGGFAGDFHGSAFSPELAAR